MDADFASKEIKVYFDSIHSASLVRVSPIVTTTLLWVAESQVQAGFFLESSGVRGVLIWVIEEFWSSINFIILGCKRKW